MVLDVYKYIYAALSQPIEGQFAKEALDALATDVADVFNLSKIHALIYVNEVVVSIEDEIASS